MPAPIHEVLSLLCCPRCRGELCIHSRITLPNGTLKSGVLLCPLCADIAGVVRNFKFDFLHFDAEQARRRIGGPDLEIPGAIEDIVRFDDVRIQPSGNWEKFDGKYLLNHGSPGDVLEFVGDFLDVGVRLLKHPWSGVVEILLDGHLVRQVDLYQPRWSTVTWFSAANDVPPGRHSLEIRVTGRRNPAAEAAQILFHELVLTRACDGGSVPSQREDLNRVLPVFPSVVDLMKQVPEEGWILDCGGGDRMFADSRYINLEFQEYQLPSVYGDAHRLPFRSDSFDLVFSQAVLEHVRNPFLAVEEMGRVAKTGGRVWAGMAFLQPVHAVPSHYFNATIWGAEELFRKLEILERSWFGDLSFTIEWLLQTANIPQKMPPEDYQELLRRVKTVDSFISYNQLRDVASGVAILARKPSSGDD